MNKGGQFQAIGIFFQVLIVLFFLASGFASNITYWTEKVIIADGLTGLTAFLLAYFNLWIILSLMLVTSIGANMIGGGE